MSRDWLDEQMDAADFDDERRNAWIEDLPDPEPDESDADDDEDDEDAA